tara:strand:+ start:178 stop:633 length:456 start_codon:yes stop_codon:yes gene_type:complete
MDKVTDSLKLVNLLDENLEIAELTLAQIEKQGNQIENVEESITYTEYISKKSSKVINRMTSFFNRLLIRQITYIYDRQPDTNNFSKKYNTNINNHNVNNCIFTKIDRLKEISLEMNSNINNQNDKLNNLELGMDTNNNIISNNSKKIKKIL